jgi:hypothetical protein
MEDFMLRQCVAAGGTDGAYAAQVLYGNYSGPKIVAK